MFSFVPGRHHIQHGTYYYFGTDEQRRLTIWREHTYTDEPQPYTAMILFESEKDADDFKTGYHKMYTAYNEKYATLGDSPAMMTWYSTKWYPMYKRFQTRYGTARIPIELHDFVHDIQDYMGIPQTRFPFPTLLRTCSRDSCYEKEVPIRPAFLTCGYCKCAQYCSQKCLDLDHIHHINCFRKCMQCGKKETAKNQFKCCGQCHEPYYCNVHCQKKHWKLIHRAECRDDK